VSIVNPLIAATSVSLLFFSESSRSSAASYKVTVFVASISDRICCIFCEPWFDVVWFGVVWFGVMWCGAVWCGVVWCSVVWCGVVWFDVVWFGVVWCGVMWCGVT
jgi:hypothetical protein